MFDTLIHNVQIASCNLNSDDGYGSLDHNALAIVGDKIVELFIADAASALPAASQVIDGRQAWITPGLIDCHTHLVYGGNRATEFARRLNGESYESIARQGGGILSTVAATRAASENELFDLSLPRILALAAEGVCTVEIKSGYGLDRETELRMLRVGRRLGVETGMETVCTILAAHAIPPEFAGRSDDYIQLVCEEIIPAAAEEGLAAAVDVFCEGIAFSPTQCERVFAAAAAHGLQVKGHVEQLSHLGGASLVARSGGLSADHVEYIDAADIAAMRDHGTTAVLLPGAFYTLGETQLPPVAELRKAEVPMAIASDLNPGSAPIASLLMNMNMACIQFGLTAQESLMGVTHNAALALGLGGRKGRVAEGYDADLVLWDIADPAELSYGYNLVRPAAIWRGGKRVL